MTELNREYLIVPTPGELAIALESMRARTHRAASRGEKARNFGDIGYANANRVLSDSPHLAEHLGRVASNMTVVAEDRGLTTAEVFLAGAKDILEIMSVATTYTRVADIDSK